MLEEFLIASAFFSLAVYFVARYKGRRARTLVLITRAERDASVYEGLLEKSRLLLPSKLAARSPADKIGYALVPLSLALITYLAFMAVQTKSPQGQLVIPGVTIKTTYGIVGVILAISYGVVIHESAHAFAGILRGYRPKSTGIITIGPLLLAYVSFEEEENIDAHVASAGIVANVFFGLIVMASFIALVKALEPYATGVLVTSGPSRLVGKVIVGVNGHPVHNVSQFIDVRSSIPSGEEVTFEFMDGTTAEFIKGSASFAITNRYFTGLLGEITAYVLAILYRSFVVNLSLGFINALPIIGLDGSKIARFGLRNKIPEEALGIIILALSAYSIVALLILLAPRRRTPSVFSPPPSEPP